MAGIMDETGDDGSNLPDDGGEIDTVDCPRCGGSFKSLPLHLPSCDGD
jgi:hypothetical protein